MFLQVLLTLGKLQIIHRAIQGASENSSASSSIQGSNLTLADGTTSPQNLIYSVTPYSADNCLGNPLVTITVNPTAQVNGVASQVLCNNESTDAINFSTENSGGTTTYAWTNNNTNIGLGASGNGNIPSFTAIAGTTSETATIVVTPTFTNNNVQCTGPTETFTITVNPTAQVNEVASQVLCNTESTDAINFSTENLDGTTTYAWTNNNTATGLEASGNGNIPSFTATAGTSPEVSTITVTPTYTNNEISCTGPSFTFSITVNPTAQVDLPDNYEYCDGDTTDIVFTTSNGGDDSVTTYSWAVISDEDLGLPSTGDGNISELVTNITNDILTATISVTPTYTNAGESCFHRRPLLLRLALQHRLKGLIL